MNRTLKLRKDTLIEKIKENKKLHIKEYKEAVLAYKKEAEKQLKNLLEELSNGKTDLKLDLVEPLNEEEKYDDLIEMFEVDVNTVLELTKSEYDKYYKDRSDFAQFAKHRNSFYSSVN